jgi:hypothetical protein
MTATPKESQTQNNELQPGVPEESPQRYANIRYEKPDPSGRYRKAFAWVGTLEQITDMVCPSPLPYQFELFGDGDFVTFSNGRLNVMPGDGYFEVFDIEKVTQAFPDLEVVYAIDVDDLEPEELQKIQDGTYTQEDEYLWHVHESFKNQTLEGLAVALVRGPIPYREDLVRAFMECDGESAVDVVKGLKFALEKLGDDGKWVANQSLLAQDAQCWVHDLDS